MTTTTKTRLRPFTKSPGDETWTVSGTTYHFDELIEIVGSQTTTSTGNPFHLLGRTDRDIGANFDTVDNFLIVDGVKLEPDGLSNKLKVYSFKNGVGNRSYTGPRIPSVQTFPTVAKPSNTALDALGTTMIARTIPTRTDASLATFLGELKEGLPSLIGANLWRSRIKDFRALGSEYLNVKFGWQPLINDIKSFASAVSDGDKILAQLERDSGRNVRRTYSFRPEREVVSNSVNTNSHLAPALATGTVNTALSLAGTLTSHRERETRTWFSGCYTYYLSPETRGRVAEIARKCDLLLGLELTPEVLWELTPWSWAVDYFSNVGDVMTNVSYFSQDNLLLRYGYVMNQITEILTQTWTGPIPGYGQISTYASYGTIRKSRRKATPYGFGLDVDGLNPSQWAILVALGIARAPKLL